MFLYEETVHAEAPAPRNSTCRLPGRSVLASSHER